MSNRATLSDVMNFAAQGKIQVASEVMGTLMRESPTDMAIQRFGAHMYVQLAEKRLSDSGNIASPGKRNSVKKLRGRAIDAFKMVLKLNENDTDSMVGIASVAKNMFLVGMGFDYARRALAIDPYFIPAWRVLEELYTQSHERDRAHICGLNAQFIKDGRHGDVVKAVADPATGSKPKTQILDTL